MAGRQTRWTTGGPERTYLYQNMHLNSELRHRTSARIGPPTRPRAFARGDRSLRSRHARQLDRSSAISADAMSRGALQSASFRARNFDQIGSSRWVRRLLGGDDRRAGSAGELGGPGVDQKWADMVPFRSTSGPRLLRSTLGPPSVHFSDIPRRRTYLRVRPSTRQALAAVRR